MVRILDDKVDEIINLYGRGFGTTKIARLYNCSPTVIIRILKEHDIELIGARFNTLRKYKINDDYFCTPNLKNSYWAGLIASDGCIKGRNNNVLNFHIHRDDRILLDEFIKDTNCEKRYFFDKNPKHISLDITSDKIAFDLQKNFNITPAKTFTLEPPFIDNKELLKAFLIGYIDGDGWISRNKNNITLGLVANKTMAEWFRNIIKDIFNIEFCFYHRGNIIYQVSKSGKDVIKMCKQLDEMNVTSLRRKWDKIYFEKEYKKLRKNNNTGYVGISFRPERNKWLARFRREFLGYFDNKIDAAKKYDEIVLKNGLSKQQTNFGGY